jgi:hypothetical protein
MFDEAAAARTQGHETFGGLPCLDPYRTTQHKLASNSSTVAHNKNSPPDGVREKRYGNAVHFSRLALPCLTFLFAPPSSQFLSSAAISDSLSLNSWANGLDTVFTDMAWLSEVLFNIVTHNGEGLLRRFEGNHEMHLQARNLVKNGLLLWSPGSSSLLRHLWEGLMPGSDFRRIRNVLEVKRVLVPQTRLYEQVCVCLCLRL